MLENVLSKYFKCVKAKEEASLVSKIAEQWMQQRVNNELTVPTLQLCGGDVESTMAATTEELVAVTEGFTKAENENGNGINASTNGLDETA